MRIVCQRARERRVLRGSCGLVLPAMLSGCLVLVAGCASPGRPQPPSLRLPTPVTDLRAERVGGAVELRWTTPAKTTDGVALRGAVVTELCRDAVTAPLAAGAAAACTVVRRWSVAQGASTAEDALPAVLLAEPAGAMVYRVRLLNGAGHDAGVSNAALAASGRAPEEIAGLRASSAARGVRLRWTASAGSEAAIEIMRTDLREPERTAGAGRPKSATGRGAGGSGHGPAKGAAGDRLMVDAGVQDAGGAIDATAVRDRSYDYVVSRVRTVRVAGESLELRGPASAAVTVAVKDLAAPTMPRELVSAVDGLTVDLSWEPGDEADLAGYRVYRAEMPAGEMARTVPPAAPWTRVNAALLPGPAFHDIVLHGGRYAYRVTAVDGSGNESAAGAAVAVSVGAGSQP